MTAARLRLSLAALLLATAFTPASAAGPSAMAGGVRWSFDLSPVPAMPDSLTLVAASARRRARERFALADTSGADSALASPAMASSVWAWESARQRAEVSLVRRDTAGADGLLASLDPKRWPDADRAEWIGLRASTRLALGDTARALELAHQVTRGFPGLAPARSALRLIESVRAARGETATDAERRAAVEVSALGGDRATAVARLIEVRQAAPRDEQSPLALRIATLSRQRRRFDEAKAWADSSHRSAIDARSRDRAMLERARIARDSRSRSEALRRYDDLARTAVDPQVRETATWELAREAQDAGEYVRAEEAFVRVTAAEGSRANDARVLAGLCAYARGSREPALAHWVAADGEPARFWEATALRSRVRDGEARAGDGARADSMLFALAARPGYRFHRAAARESLGVRGWSGQVAPIACRDSLTCVQLASMRAIVEAGDTLDAVTLLQRWMAGDARATMGRRPAPGSWLDAAAIAYGVRRPDLGTRCVDRSLEASEDSAAVIWPLIPWAYPPAFEELVRRPLVDSLGIETALLWGLLRQESRFAPRARSSSNALGLAQFLRSTAGDVARWYRDPAPTEERLFEPEVSIRYGARYLSHLLGRFDQRPAVALAAYNAGPGTIRRDWRDLIDRGGDALFSEFASNADSQDYARRILGYRQAYRELAPTARR